MYEKYANLFKVLSDPTRIKIIELLIKGETCGCTLIDNFPLTQPTLSYHLKVITESGLARSRKDGTWVKYSINKEVLTTLSNYLIILRDTEEEKCKL